MVIWVLLMIPDYQSNDDLAQYLAWCCTIYAQPKFSFLMIIIISIIMILIIFIVIIIASIGYRSTISCSTVIRSRSVISSIV